MIRDGKLFGRAKLTAVLRPLLSPFGGANYFASRLQTSLRYPKNGKWGPLVGSMLESTLKEQDARKELRKWQPVRCHYKDFSKGASGDVLRSERPEVAAVEACRVTRQKKSSPACSVRQPCQLGIGSFASLASLRLSIAPTRPARSARRQRTTQAGLVAAYG